MDILDALKDLHKQATEERSHYYTGKVILEAIHEIEQLRSAPGAAKLAEQAGYTRGVNDTREFLLKLAKKATDFGHTKNAFTLLGLRQELGKLVNEENKP